MYDYAFRYIMKDIKIDDNAHEVLLWARERCTQKGIEKPNYSDAIRWMKKNSKLKKRPTNSH